MPSGLRRYVPRAVRRSLFSRHRRPVATRMLDALTPTISPARVSTAVLNSVSGLAVARSSTTRVADIPRSVCNNF